MILVIVIFVVPVKIRSEPTLAEKVPPFASEGVVDKPGGKYTRLIEVPEEKSRYIVNTFIEPATPVGPV
jgi:hypothetical protein